MKTNKQVKKDWFDPTVHHDIKGRKRFKRNMILMFLLLLVILMICAVMFMFGGWTWDPNQGPYPISHPTAWWHYLLIIFAAVISLGCVISYPVICIRIFKKFYKTQEEYFKTDDFKKKQEKVLNSDLTKEKISTIKWYKKLGYITGQQKAAIIEKIKIEKKNRK